VKGTVEAIVQEMIQDLQSAMSFGNATSIEEFHQCRFFPQTAAGYEEGLPKK